MSVVVRNALCLVGEEFVPQEGTLVVVDGVIARFDAGDAIGPVPPDAQVIDGAGMVVMPGLVNAHVHVFDGAFKESWIGRTIEELFREDGVKFAQLQAEGDAGLDASCGPGVVDMFASGTTTAYAFVEEGLRGIAAVRRAAAACPLRLLALGLFRNPSAFDDAELAELLEAGDGLALSSLNPYTDDELDRTADAVRARGGRDCVVATHIAEAKPTTNFARAVDQYRPHFLVHGNFLDEAQLRTLAAKDVGLVCCIRSGKSFGNPAPDLKQLADLGVRFAFGTDNFMSNTPDMFRELEFVTRDLMIRHKGKLPVSAERILRAATVDAARIAGIDNLGLIQPGFKADLVLLRRDSFLTPMRGAISILLRAGAHQVSHVIKDGRVVAIDELRRLIK